MVSKAPTLAEQLEPLLEDLVGPNPPLALVAWDGSRCGPADAPLVVELHGTGCGRLDR
jgi:hypothetical protein